jgi:hypothetical protein
MSLRRLLIGTAALPAALAMMLGCPRDASAANITYTFSNDASITFADGNVEDVSGSFVFTTTGGLISNANITLSGASPEAGTYDTDPFYDTSGGPAVCGHTSGDVPTFCMWFNTDLGGSTSAFVTSPPGGGIGYFPTNPGINVIETAVDGGVSSNSAIPEPSSLALLAGAIGFFGFRRRAARQDRSPPRISGDKCNVQPDLG